MRSFLFFGILLFSCSLFAQPAIEAVIHASNFDSPVDITHAGDERLFIVEQDGYIQILDADNNTLATPFLDIDSRVSSGGERGLLGLAFHPDYANNGYFFVNYINNNGDTQISRFSVSATDANLADPDSEVMLLTIDQPYGNHNGGCIKFGPDGYLYIGMGDGGSGGDPQGYGQNRQSLLGKMLRIDVDNGSPYGIPADNPFASDDQTLDEIWAIGLRNPWRFSFDRQTGDLWIGDVGQNQWEEIDFQPASSAGGENYGWRCYEGFHTYNTSGCDNADAYDDPIYEYSNSFDGGCSVTGGMVYRGSEIPALQGIYVFSDYCAGILTSVTPDGMGGWTGTELFDSEVFVSSFGEDVNGELYFANLFGGDIYKIVDACASFSDNVSVSTQDESCAGDADGSITVTAPAGSTATWSTGDMGLTLNGLSAADFSVTVSNAAGCEAMASATISSQFPALEAPTVDMDVNEVSVADTYASYQWHLAGAPIMGATMNAYTAQEDGQYYVVVTDANGCSATSNTVDVMVVSTLEALNIQSLQLSPVPFKESFSIAMQTELEGKYSFSIQAANGQVMKQFSENILGAFSKTIQMESAAAGVYFLVIEQAGKRYVQSVVKQ